MYFSYENSNKLIPLHVDEAKRLRELSKRNKIIPDLENESSQKNVAEVQKDNIDEINIDILGKRNKKRKNKRFS